MMCEATQAGFEHSRGYDEVFNFIQTLFPARPIVANDKKHFKWQQKVARSEAIESFTWVQYNHAWLNVLIFDIDYPISLREAYNLSLEKIGLEPTWISETTKGVHIAYVLTNMVKFDWKPTINLARHIKASVTKELSADDKGSHRLSGFWRNPLMHNYYASLKTYSLEDFYPVSNKYDSHFKKINIQQQFNKDVVKRQIKYNNIYFKHGNRNNTLWYTAMQHTNPAMTSEEIESIILSLHHNYTQHNTHIALDDTEVATIARSVVKYNKNNANFVNKSSYQEKSHWKIGAMHLPPMRNLTRDEYMQETTKRKAAAAQYTANKKYTRTKKAIIDAIHRLKFLLLDTTVRNIAAYAKRSIGTISRYLKEEDILSLLGCSISSKHVIGQSGNCGGSLGEGTFVFFLDKSFRILVSDDREIVLERIQIE